MSAEQRTRFEHLGSDYRANATGDATGLSLRTLLAAQVGRGGVRVSLELEDSRAYASDGAPLNTTDVDALELLQASMTLRREGMFSPGDVAFLRLGRFTMNVGSRRLVARSVFRNTINAFTGLELLRATASDSLRLFAVLPVTRRPSDPVDLANNRIRMDREDDKALLWGAAYESAGVGGDVRLEAYVVGLVEANHAGDPSLSRRLVTPGVRMLRSPAPGRLDFELEAMLQVGTSRATADSADARDLAHRAFAGHASAGYRFRGRWAPHVALQYDYASGDRDPGDEANNRFDPLFGARAFELNASGFYGPFARSNISSPGIRAEASPNARLRLMAAYRLYWLASARDAWTAAKVRDASGRSGDFVGRQLEARMRVSLLPGRLTLDVGGAHLSPGMFARTAGGMSAAPMYFYSQITLTGAAT